MTRKHKLSSAVSFDYSIIGIATQLKDFKLCLFINEALGIKLTRTGEIPVYVFKSETLMHFPFYRFYDTTNKINWYLISNKNHQQQLMLPEMKQLNFFLINDGMPPYMEIKNFITSIRQIRQVQIAQEFSAEKSKGLIYMLQDLEMYVLELDRKNKP
jgi:hypothetical protein